jgi:hypothetical protein
LAHYVRQVLEWEVDADNAYSVDALLKMRLAEERELARREAVRNV